MSSSSVLLLRLSPEGEQGRTASALQIGDNLGVVVINGIAGIRTITSESRDERSTITVEFTLDSDLSDAANDVRDRVSRAIRDLPVDANPPVVEKADADSSPILFLSLLSDERSILEVSDIADRIVRERMETIPGVSSVRIFGEKRYAMRLWMDPVKMAVHSLTPADVQEALDRRLVRREQRLGVQPVALRSGRVGVVERLGDLLGQPCPLGETKWCSHLHRPRPRKSSW